MQTYIICLGVVSHDCNYEEWLEIEAESAQDAIDRIQLIHKYDAQDITYDYVFNKDCSIKL